MTELIPDPGLEGPMDSDPEQQGRVLDWKVPDVGIGTWCPSKLQVG